MTEEHDCMECGRLYKKSELTLEYVCGDCLLREFEEKISDKLQAIKEVFRIFLRKLR